MGVSKIDKIKRLWQELFLLIGFVLGLTVLIVFLAGAPPFEALKHLFLGSLGSWIKFSSVLRAWIPLCLCAFGLLFSFRIGLWNIGVEGQVVAGAISATALLRIGIDSSYPGIFICLAFLAAIIGGSLWASIVGFLKTKAGVSEIFAGLGLNFVAMGLTLWLIFGPWKRPGVASMSGTQPFEMDLWLPTIQSLRISPIGLGLAIFAFIVSAWLLERTRLGLALKGIGNNSKAAYLHGLKPNRYMLYAMILSGGFAGMAGAFQVTGVYHRFIPSISSNYGYLALLVVMLANLRIKWTPLIAFFFACLNVGSIQLPMMLKIDSSLSGVIQGVFVLGILLINSWRKRAEGSGF